MFKNVIFMDTVLSAWIPPEDLWGVLAKSPRPSDKHVLAQIADDAPHRWVLLAE